MDLLLSPDIWIAFFTLAALEIVLGIDNVIFVSILADKLPDHQKAKARRLGLGLAMLMRIALLFAISWIIGLTEPLFTVFSEEISGRDLILLVGGLFLLAKSVYEIHDSLESGEGHRATSAPATFGAVIAQIIALDLVFSLDSVLTAVALVDEIAIMVAAIIVAVGVMMFSAELISGFVERHPSLKMLALSFLVLIGFTLVAEAFDQHISKPLIYFAMGFSVAVESLNILSRRRSQAKPVQLRHRVSKRAPTEDADPQD